MRLALPPLAIRRHVVAGLRDFHDHQDRAVLTPILKALADFYGLRPPVVELRRRPLRGVYAWTLDTRPTRIQIVAPEVFERLKPGEDYPAHDCDAWVDVFLHELGHWYCYCDAERKADAFARAFQHGVSGNP
jgi:hypothetical protein